MIENIAFGLFAFTITVLPLALILGIINPRLNFAKSRPKAIRNVVAVAIMNIAIIIFIITAFEDKVFTKDDIENAIERNGNINSALNAYEHLAKKNEESEYIKKAAPKLITRVKSELESFKKNDNYEDGLSLVENAKKLLTDADLSKYRTAFEEMKKAHDITIEKQNTDEQSQNASLTASEPQKDESDSDSDSDSDSISNEKSITESGQLTGIIDNVPSLEWSILGVARLKESEIVDYVELEDENKWRLQTQISILHNSSGDACAMTNKYKILSNKINAIHQENYHWGLSSNVFAYNAKKKLKIPLCVLTDGTWTDEITGEIIKSPDGVRLDYLVPITELIKSGLDKFTADKLYKFVNNNELMVFSSENYERRLEGDLDDWLPDDEVKACALVKGYAKLKYDGHFSFSDNDMDVIDDYHNKDVENDSGFETNCFISSIYSKGIVSGRLFGDGEMRSGVEIRD